MKDLVVAGQNDGHTAYEFQVTAHNIQFDAAMEDHGGGENAAPDFFWESATRRTFLQGVEPD